MLELKGILELMWPKPLFFRLKKSEFKDKIKLATIT